MQDQVQNPLQDFTIGQRVTTKEAYGVVVGQTETAVIVFWEDDTLTNEEPNDLSIIRTPENLALTNVMILRARAKKVEEDAQRVIDAKWAEIRLELDQYFAQAEKAKQAGKGLDEAARILALSINASSGSTRPHANIKISYRETVKVNDFAQAKQWVIDNNRFDALEVNEPKLKVLVKAGLVPSEIATAERVASPSIDKDLSALLTHELVEVPAQPALESDAPTTEAEAQ